MAKNKLTDDQFLKEIKACQIDEPDQSPYHWIDDYKKCVEQDNPKLTDVEFQTHIINLAEKNEISLVPGRMNASETHKSYELNIRNPMNNRYESRIYTKMLVNYY